MSIPQAIPSVQASPGQFQGCVILTKVKHWSNGNLTVRPHPILERERNTDKE
jgi:hypothetical protein